MYPAVLLMYFIAAAVILLLSLALIVQVSLPYNKTGRASVLYSFILVFLRVFLWSCLASSVLRDPQILGASVQEFVQPWLRLCAL